VTQAVGGNSFQLEIPLCKTWEDENGDLLFEGVASSTALDRQKERMSKQAIEAMSQYRGIDLLPSHDAGALRELGTVDQCWADNDRFEVRGRLDKSVPEAWRLYERAKSGRQYGLSVGGRVLKAHWEFDDEAADRIRVLDDVVLDHIALCRPGQAANPETYLGVMSKAADAVAPWPSETEDAEADPVLEADEEAARDTEMDTAVSVSSGVGRITRVLADVCRLLWPLCHSEGVTKGGTEVDEDPIADISADVDLLRKQLDGVEQELEELSKSFDAQRGGQATDELGPIAATGAEHDVNEAEELCGGRQSIDGQERRAGDGAKLWKGVL